MATSCELCGKLLPARSAALVGAYTHPDGSQGVGCLCAACRLKLPPAPPVVQGEGVLVTLAQLEELLEVGPRQAALLF